MTRGKAPIREHLTYSHPVRIQFLYPGILPLKILQIWSLHLCQTQNPRLIQPWMAPVLRFGNLLNMVQWSPRVLATLIALAAH